MALHKFSFGVLPRPELTTQLPAVHQQRGPSDVAGPVARQEDRGLRHLVRFAAAAHRDCPEVILDHRRRIERGLRQPCTDQPRIYTVHPDAIRSQFIGRRMQNPQHPRLRRVIGDQVLLPVVGVCRRRQHNRPRPLRRLHPRGCRLQCLKCRRQVQRNGLIPNLPRRLLQRLHNPRPGVYEQRVRHARNIERRLNTRPVRHIAPHVPAREIDLVIGVNVENKNVRPARRQPPRHRPAYPMCPAGDDSGLALECEFHRLQDIH